jgi:predicted lipid-binding transport protein (Tim44 family)
MARRSPQAQVALIAAAVFLVVGVSLAAVLLVGLIDGVTGTGPLLLAGLAVGVFALAIRLLMLARRPVAPARSTTPAPPRQSPRSAAPNTATTARPVHPRPHPRPKSMRP